MGDSNQTALYFGEEEFWGTLATCTFQELRFTGESFAYNITNITNMWDQTMEQTIKKFKENKNTPKYTLTTF